MFYPYIYFDLSIRWNKCVFTYIYCTNSSRCFFALKFEPFSILLIHHLNSSVMEIPNELSLLLKPINTNNKSIQIRSDQNFRIHTLVTYAKWYFSCSVNNHFLIIRYLDRLCRMFTYFPFESFVVCTDNEHQEA